jgi:alpha-mannosidase
MRGLTRKLGLAMAALVVLAGSARAADNLVNPYRPSVIVKDYELQLKKAGFAPDQLRVHSIGQSHIDAAWRWKLAQTHIKVYKTWGQAVELIKRHPEFTFSGSSGQYYEWLLDEHPDLFEEIVELEKTGRWEIVGGMWVEPDCNMPSGESFCRQYLLGQRFYLEHFGHTTQLTWLLDSFGYTRNLPQFAGRAGCKYMWTSKLTWNDTTVFPFHNFQWRAPDGTEVVTYICPIVPLPTYFPFAELGKFKDTHYLVKPGIKFVADYSTLPQQYDQALSSDWLNVMGSFYGVGDGGLGPREEEVQIQEALAAKGYTRFTPALPLFQEVEAAGDRLPVWNDEMYLEAHRGVLTSQTWIKEANRNAESQMTTTEGLRSILHVFGTKYPYEELKKIWKRILLNQFHDILPGSSIPEVYDDARADYKWIRTATEEIKDAGIKELARLATVKAPAEGADGVVVYNGLAWPRSGLVSMEVPSGKPYQVMDSAGAAVPSQIDDSADVDRIIFRATEVPAMGYKTYFVKPLDQAPPDEGGPTVIESDTVMGLENEHVKVLLDKKTGWIKAVFDKKSGKQLIKAPSNKLLTFFNKPKQYSAWELAKGYLDHPIDLPEAASITVTSRGPLFSELRVRRYLDYLGRTTTFDQRIRLAKGDPLIYLDLDADYHVPDSVTKLEFNTVLHADTVTAENPYYMMERTAHPATDRERARWEMPCEKWIDMSAEGVGLALFNRGKHGFSLNDDQQGYRLSVFKSAAYPRANPGAKEVKHQYWTAPIPTGETDEGAHHAEMALLAHAGSWREAKLYLEGYNFNTPLEATWVAPHEGKLPAEGSLISLDSASSFIGAVKRAEEDADLVVRVVEAEGKSGPATIKFGLGMEPVSAAETDLIELNPKDLGASGNAVTLDMKPYEIRTVKIKFKQAAPPEVVKAKPKAKAKHHHHRIKPKAKPPCECNCDQPAPKK